MPGELIQLTKDLLTVYGVDSKYTRAPRTPAFLFFLPSLIIPIITPLVKPLFVPGFCQLFQLSILVSRLA